MSEGGYVFNEQGQRLFFNEEERKAFIEAAEYEATDKGRTFCNVLHYTGCKLTEALTLTPRHIDCARSTIVLTPRLRDVPRTVPVPGSLIELLDKTHRIRRAQHGIQADEPIWPYHVNTMTKPVLRVIADSGITGGPHATPKGIRYGYLVHAIRERIILTRIHAWMGHVSLDYTACKSRSNNPSLKRPIGSAAPESNCGI